MSGSPTQSIPMPLLSPTLRSPVARDLPLYSHSSTAKEIENWSKATVTSSTAGPTGHAITMDEPLYFPSLGCAGLIRNCPINCSYGGLHQQAAMLFPYRSQSTASHSASLAWEEELRGSTRQREAWSREGKGLSNALARPYCQEQAFFPHHFYTVWSCVGVSQWQATPHPSTLGSTENMKGGELCLFHADSEVSTS